MVATVSVAKKSAMNRLHHSCSVCVTGALPFPPTRKFTKQILYYVILLKDFVVAVMKFLSLCMLTCFLICATS